MYESLNVTVQIAFLVATLWICHAANRENTMCSRAPKKLFALPLFFAAIAVLTT